MLNTLVLAWYGWLSGLTQGLVLDLQGLADSIALPAAAALIFGLIGATSPCQLSTNLSALAYASAQPARGRPFLLGVAYTRPARFWFIRSSERSSSWPGSGWRPFRFLSSRWLERRSVL